MPSCKHDYRENGKSGKGLPQLGHVCVLAVIDTRTAEARGVDL
jgi:hypothetical protein